MSDAFDPYYIWLGIPPEDQPPNHYRLLGVTLFESNREVIEAAANRQMAYMQEISAGDEHIDEAQKILGELSKARVCLLNSEKKAAYDAELRDSFDALVAAPEPPATAKKQSSLVPIIGLVIVTLVVIGGGVTFSCRARQKNGKHNERLISKKKNNRPKSSVRRRQR